MKILWSFQPISDLNFETGFVKCEEALALQLIADGNAQDPKIGGWLLKPITDQQITPPPSPLAKKKSGRKAKAKSEVIDVDSE